MEREMKAPISASYLRAIAKVGFHFFLKQCRALIQSFAAGAIHPFDTAGRMAAHNLALDHLGRLQQTDVM